MFEGKGAFEVLKGLFQWPPKLVGFFHFFTIFLYFPKLKDVTFIIEMYWKVHREMKVKTTKFGGLIISK
jgi:hypothetical protein